MKEGIGAAIALFLLLGLPLLLMIPEVFGKDDDGV